MRAALPWNCSEFPAVGDAGTARSLREVHLLSVMLDLLLWLQPDATGVPHTGAPSGGGGGGAAGCGAGDPSLFMLLGMFALMYFILFGPERKRQKKHQEMLKALKKGDIVRTDSGIRGEILSLTERDAVVLVDVKTKITILRTRIAGPEAEVSAEKSEKPKDDTEKGKEKEG